MSLELEINGNRQTLDAGDPSPLDHILTALGTREDRIAVEVNGEIKPRSGWKDISIRSGDRLEIVHFVGGGALTVELEGHSVTASNSYR